MMLARMAVTAGIITALMLAWVAVQALKRRSDPRYRRGDDVLAGCDACSLSGACDALHGNAGACPEDGRVPARSH